MTPLREKLHRQHADASMRGDTPTLRRLDAAIGGILRRDDRCAPDIDSPDARPAAADAEALARFLASPRPRWRKGAR